MCDYRLSSLEPVVDAWMRMHMTASGWELTLGHRHYSGVMGDCDPDQYHNLSLDEAVDVILSSVAGWSTLTPADPASPGLWLPVD